MAMFVPQPAETALAAMVTAAQPALELPQGQTLSGTVKAWMEDKGFGFITPDFGGPDVFVHRNQLSDGQSLTASASVLFECRLNVARGKYEATTCSGAAGTPSSVAQAAPLDIGGKGMAMRGSQDNLFVAGLPIESTEEQIRDMFGQYGIVNQVKVLPDTPGKMDRAALVRFADEQQAKWMVENLNGRTLPGLVAPLTVRFAGDKGGGFFGKAGGKGEMVVDNRFSPYGAVSTLAAQVTTAANPQLSDATLAAALIQLLPGLNQNGQQQGLQVGIGAPDASAAVAPAAGQFAAAGQQVGVQQFGGQPFAGQALGGQPLLGQALAGQALVGQAAGVQQFAGQPVTSPGLPGQALLGQTAPGQALPVQAAAGVQPAAALQQLGAAAFVGQMPALGSQTMPSGGSPAVAAAAPVAATAPGAAAAAPALAASTGGQWLEASDPASGRSYYYHSVTREVRWEKPAE